MSHNQLMTGLILAIILALASFLLYRIFFGDSQESSSAGISDGAEIEQTLKKILAQTSNGAAASATATSIATEGDKPAAAGAAAVPSADVEKLKAELAANQKLVADLKASAASGGGAAGGDQTPELLAKIKILEDRLSEYEIIEDDIADLSIYKEENAKLKKELEALKGGAVLKNEAATAAIDAVAAATAPAAPAPAAEPTPAPVDPGQVQTAVSTPAEDAEAIAAQLIAEKAAKAAPPTPVPAAPAPAATPATTSTTVSSTENVQGSSDVFAEFQGGENADPLAGLGDLDADRMLEEIKDLGEGSGDPGVLDEAVDLDKMAKETSTKG